MAGATEERVALAIADELGAAVEVEIAGELPRRHMPRPCVGHMEREERRLQLRFVLRGDEHVDDIVVAEDDECVVVYGIVCTSSPEPAATRTRARGTSTSLGHSRTAS